MDEYTQGFRAGYEEALSRMTSFAKRLGEGDVITTDDHAKAADGFADKVANPWTRVASLRSAMQVARLEQILDCEED